MASLQTIFTLYITLEFTRLFLRSAIGSGNDIVSQLFVKTTLVELGVKDFNNLYIAHIM